LADLPAADVVGGAGTLSSFRVNLWQQTLLLIHDFPLTGSGLGAFQEIGPLFYSVPVYSNYHLGHAHNFWLQAGVDFGIPGLIAVLALYSLAIFHLYRSRQKVEGFWQRLNAPPATERTPPPARPIVIRARSVVNGLIGCLVAQSVFSLTDSISMGGTPNLLFWYLFALIFALSSYLDEAESSIESARSAASD
jgi:O-antigen ligase